MKNPQLPLQDWLNLVCTMLPHVTGAVLVLQKGSNTVNQTPSVKWPLHFNDTSDLLDAIQLAAKRSSPVFNIKEQLINDKIQPRMLVAYPLFIEEQLFAVISLELEADSTQQNIVSQLLSWSNVWLELLLTSHQEVKINNEYLHILNQGLASESIQESITITASRLANEFHCERVAIGLLTRNSVQVKGISHNATFDRRQNLIQYIEEIMAETCHQNLPIRFPSKQPLKETSNKISSNAFEQLSHENDQSFIHAIPLLHNGKSIGAVTLERKQSPLGTEELKACEAAIAIITSLIIIKQKPISIVKQVLQRTKTTVQQIIGPGHQTLKTTFISCFCIGVLLIFGDMQYRVRAQASLEGSIQRVITAPFDGYIAQSYARAGENIDLGEPIAALDFQEIKLEHQRWISQRDELVKQYRQALSTVDYVQVKIYKAQIAQTEAQITLLQQNIDRAILTAPLKGIIISGDLSRTLGAPVERGQILFEIAPLEKYRLVLMIDERDIKDLAVGQTGNLSLSALPKQNIRFKIERIATEFQEQKDRVVYRTEASLDSDISMLRPGMQGIAKVDIEPRNISWILFHRLVDWIRFELWSWLP